jgi:GxxExxY protein
VQHCCMQQDQSPGAELTYQIIGLAMQVHRVLGPGLLESIYEKCLCYKLAQARIPFARQVALPLRYGSVTFDSGCMADIIVDEQVILELKAVERILPIHEAQLLTYLRLTQCRVGLLIKLNTVSLTDGIRRRVI